MDSLSIGQARRVALVAQGFRDPRHAVPDMRTLMRSLRRTGVLQVDSVNVVQRAHYMPLYARMGPYDTGLLHRANRHTARSPRRVVEYWAHVQALMPVELWPVMQHRMAFHRAQRGKWWGVVSEELASRVLAAVTERGASTARDLDDGGPRRRDHWGWNWSETRKALDFLYMAGDLAIAGRNSQFEVIYNLPERVLPAEVLALPTPTRQEADVELVRRAATSLGVATVQCLGDYYRLGEGHTTGAKRAQAAVDRLVEAGELVPVRVDGWRRPAYLSRGVRIPRTVRARALLSPFDPLVWERSRTEALFGFRYRIEIYVPAHKRVHGYYVLPFLLGDRLVGRVDLKADRQAGVLQVRAAYAEPKAPHETAEELAAELRELAGWLGLDEIVVHPRGDLAPALTAVIHGSALAASRGR
ncbi:MAG: winged helix-turn-helix domain-containing protein [Marmoricola sp.]